MAAEEADAKVGHDGRGGRFSDSFDAAAAVRQSVADGGFAAAVYFLARGQRDRSRPTRLPSLYLSHVPASTIERRAASLLSPRASFVDGFHLLRCGSIPSGNFGVASEKARRAGRSSLSFPTDRERCVSFPLLGSPISSSSSKSQGTNQRPPLLLCSTTERPTSSALCLRRAINL